MNILILTQYFPPEVGAPQNRLYEIAIRLQRSGIQVTVLTAMPNYPQMSIHQEYKGKWQHYEEKEGIKIYRSHIYVSKNRSIISRLLNYFSFVFSSALVGTFKLKKYDYLLCESPPLFLGISALYLSRIKKAKLIFNVSDLWPESAEKLGLIKNRFLLNASTRLEEFIYKRSILICGQTQGIVKNIHSRFPIKKVYWLPNGVDTEFYNPDLADSSWRKKNNFSTDNFLLIYAGILGYAQGLEVIIKAANLLNDYTNIKFILLGDGPVKGELISLKEKLNAKNVFFIPGVSKKEMPEIIKSIDVAIIPLRKIDLFKGAIPSKIFETLAMKKPILLGLEGEAKELFIDEGKAGLAFEPENDKDLAKKIILLFTERKKCEEYGHNGSEYVKNKFNRDLIAQDFIRLLQSL